MSGRYAKIVKTISLRYHPGSEYYADTPIKYHLARTGPVINLFRASTFILYRLNFSLSNNRTGPVH